ncbi:MAG: hypothetical protein EXQ96_03820 [Alphaproteobacteria bacterium]|nr:hypothetical protein [Alphaproteobacteria bacterium]
MKRGLLSSGGLILAAILFVGINIIALAGLKTARVDLTQGRLYTLSQGTLNVLSSIGEPITLRFFFSNKMTEQLPQFRDFATRVRELLEEYRAKSNGKITLEIIDPIPFTDAEDRAVQFGLTGLPIAQTGELAYFGLVGSNTTDDRQSIPLFTQTKEQQLEYDITKLIYALDKPKKPVVGILSTLPIWGNQPNPMLGLPRGQQPQEPWLIVRQLESLFEVRRLGITLREPPKGVDVLMIVHPKQVDATTQYHIDQFVLGGGKAIVFVDPQGEVDIPAPNSPYGPVRSSELDLLLRAWGVEMISGKIAADRRFAMPVNAGDANRPRALDYVVWLRLTGAAFARDDFVTADLRQINLGAAGVLRKVEGAEQTVTALVQTSDESMQVDASKFAGRPNVEGLLADFKSEGQRLMLAARIQGPAKSVFPDGPPPPEASAGQASAAPAAAAPHLAASKGPINVIVIADADMLEDSFWVQVQDFFGQQVAFPMANNADLVVNAIDNLSGSNDLISLRSRGQFSRPFSRVEAIRRDAESRFLAKEQELQATLKETQERISALQTKTDGSGQVILSAEQQKEIESFREILVNTRIQLRDVQRALRADIERLGSWVKFVNIALVPILVGMAALLLGWWRTSRRRAHARLA